MALSQLTPDILTQAISSLTPEQLKALGLRRQATDGEVAAYDQAHRPPGAPADFGGPVFANPDGVKVSDDTESGVEPTRLPNGVTLQKQNFTGSMPHDLSNPAEAQIVGPKVQTISADFSPKQIDYDALAVKHGAESDLEVDYDALAAKHGADGASQPNVPEDYLTHAEDRIDEVAKTAARQVGAAWDAITGIPGAVYHAAADPPTPEELKSLGLGKSTGPGRVANFIQRMVGGGQLAEAARYYKQYYNATPDQRRDMETEMLSVAPEAIGAGAAAALTPKLVEKLPAAAASVGDLAKKAVSKPVRTAPVRFGARAAETAINQKLLPVKKLANLMTPADEAEALNVKVPGRDYGLEKPAVEPDPVYPGADEPNIPKIVDQARPIAKGGTAVVDPAKGLSDIPVRKTAASAASEAEDLEGITSAQTEHAAATEAEAIPAETLDHILNKKAPPADLAKALNDALGGKPLQKGVSLRNQGKGPAAAAVPSLPEGFTPVESSAINGYKYDAAAREFETVTKDGRRYIHGDVSPEDAATFEAAESKGKAWQQIRNNPLVAKVIDGKRIPIVKSAAKSPVMQKAENLADFIRQSPADAVKTSTKKLTSKPPAGANDTTSAPVSADLTEKLQQSLDQVKAEKGGVFTSAAPGELLDRWGVDPESFAEGREQTRGMKPQESEADLKKLTAAYKKGQAIEPVMETRDAQNNIIEVDGRGRALAAHRAGIERIPVIVRRLQ